MNLPAGYVSRPASWDDLDAVVELFKITDRADSGVEVDVRGARGRGASDGWISTSIRRTQRARRGLYASVAMHVRRAWGIFEKPLGAGIS